MIPSSVACSNSESGFLTKCSFGLLLITPLLASLTRVKLKEFGL